MILRWLLFLIGSLALLAGVLLSALWWKAAPAKEAVAREAAGKTVLVAARALGPGTLLARADLRWKKRPASAVPAGSLLRGRVRESTLFGAALSRRFRAGEPIAEGAVIKPGEPGFIPAALSPGMRAVSVALAAAQGDAGVLEPGDRVDVVLTQNFTGSRISMTRRTVAEMVLSNLRVIAIGNRVAAGRNRRGGRTGFVRERGGRGGQTVTLEASARQVAKLMVAGRLGALQLALRGAGESKRGTAPRRRMVPVWAVEVSPALQRLEGSGVARISSPDAPGAPSRPGSSVEVLRGTRLDWRCFDRRGEALPSCSGVAFARPLKAPAKAPPPRTAGAEAPAT